MAITSYSTLKLAIADWLDRDDIDDAIDTMIDICEAEIYRRLRVSDMEAAFSVTISSGVAALPSDFLEAAYLHVGSNPVTPLQMRPSAWILEHYPTRSSGGKPAYAAVSGTNLIFGPYPDSDYSITGMYYARPTALGTGNESNWLITDHPDLLLYGALRHSAPYIGQDDRVQTWQAAYAKAMTEVMREDTQKRFPLRGALAMRI